MEVCVVAVSFLLQDDDRQISHLSGCRSSVLTGSAEHIFSSSFETPHRCCDPHVRVEHVHRSHVRLRTSAHQQNYMVGPPDQIIDSINRLREDIPLTDIISWGTPPGMHPSQVNARFERFAAEVMPHFR